MKEATNEWIVKAEGDILTARRELTVQEDPNYDAVCFHAQQCAEKYLKACLMEAGCYFPKTHDLGSLLDLVLKFEPDWAFFRDEINKLTSIGVEVKYPGISADRQEAEEAVKTAEQFRSYVRTSLSLI
jgi:HEPN domain-containing protein